MTEMIISCKTCDKKITCKFYAKLEDLCSSQLHFLNFVPDEQQVHWDNIREGWASKCMFFKYVKEEEKEEEEEE
jgi:hypothetical protein